MLPDTNLIAVSSLCTSLSLSLVALTVNNLPAMLETQVRSLGQEDPLEKEIAVLLPGESHGGRREMIGEEQET